MDKKYLRFLALALATLLMSSQLAYAAGPVINQATDNPLVGDETVFLGVIDQKTGITHVDTVDLKVGRCYIVNTTVTNDAEGTVAENVRIKSSLPRELEKYGVATLWTEISADNLAGDDEPLYRGIILRSDKAVRIEVMAGYSTLCSGGEINATEIAEEELLSEDGVLVGYDAQDGKLPGGAKYTVELIYYIRVLPVRTTAKDQEYRPRPKALA